MVLTWKGSRQADGYVIYRRYSGAAWNFCGDTGGPAEEWKDVNGDKTGAYIVVPYKNNGTEKAYGKFYYRSVSAKKG